MIVNSSNFSTKNAGLSLIELLISICILGILVSMAVPSYERYVIRAKLSQIYVILSTYKVKVALFISSGEEFKDKIYLNPVAGVASVEIKKHSSRYIIRLLADLAALRLQPINGKQLVLELSSDITDDFINWRCEIQQEYKEYSAHDCIANDF